MYYSCLRCGVFVTDKRTDGQGDYWINFIVEGPSFKDDDDVKDGVFLIAQSALSPKKHHGVPKSSIKYQKVPNMIRKYHKIPKNSIKYQKVPKRIRKYHKVPKSTIKYVRHSTKRSRRILLIERTRSPGATLVLLQIKRLQPTESDGRGTRGVEKK